MKIVNQLNRAARTRAALKAALAIALASGASLASADGPPEESAAQPVRDAWIDGRIETAYALNPYLSPFDIDTEVVDGVVTLTGTLHSDIDRDLAVNIAEGIDGVSDVEDDLTVTPDSEPKKAEPADGERTFSQWIQDATATARVKSNLVANGNTKGLAIDVDTREDVVTLKGTVGSRKEKMLAEMIAGNTDGIASVQNQLDIDEQS